MSGNLKIYDFFLGANSKNGFVSFFDELKENAESAFRSYLIKGGPGTGKSTFMRKAAALAELYEDAFELIHCSSDPGSLDGVILPKAAVTLCDATPPHTLEPRFPGAFEHVLPFTEAFDTEKLETHRKELLTIGKVYDNYQKQCVRLISAAASLLEDNHYTALAATDIDKVMRTAYRVFSREFKGQKGNEGKEHKRFLSAVTPEGLVFYKTTVTENFKKIYAVADPYGAASNLFLSALRELLLQKGTEFYSCFDPIDPYEKLDHILVPEYGIAFVTVNGLLRLPAGTETKNIHFNRFTDMEALALKKQRLRFNRRLAEEILKEASLTLKKARSIHDSMEEIYKSHVDFSFIDELYQKTAAEIVKRYENAP